jgi:hypothetical protein
MAASASDSASYWAQQLYACLQQMAALDTNAVLLTLADVDAVETGRHYPDEGLTFANKRWRAFYHCHQDSTQYQHEHGHFHIFTDIGDDDWAHVAGLSVDTSGQPIHWFAVNRWVTDGPWLEHTKFLHQLQMPAENEQDSLTGRWLFALLQFCQAEISDLLKSRDEKVRSHTRQPGLAEVLEDRELYTLATNKIELQAMLEKHLLH